MGGTQNSGGNKTGFADGRVLNNSVKERAVIFVAECKLTEPKRGQN